MMGGARVQKLWWRICLYGCDVDVNKRLTLEGEGADVVTVRSPGHRRCNRAPDREPPAARPTHAGT